MPRKNLENFAELGQFELDAAAIRRLSLAFCQHNQVVVLGSDAPPPAPVMVGLLDPDKAGVIQQVEATLRRRVTAVRLTRFEIHKALVFAHGDFPEDAYVLEASAQRTDHDGASAGELLDQMLKDAVAMRASDIHIETYREDVDVRVRLDGILHQLFTHITPFNAGEVVRRLKILAEMDITEQRRPQDGRFRATLVREDGSIASVDFRVSVVPGPVGEDAVVRVLDAEVGLLPLDVLGMSPDLVEAFSSLLNNPEGMLIVTGPTGSGKTTTLYAALRHINDGTRKIVTAEDPIEYYIPKINQKQVSDVVSMGDLLRALLRQDPDIMLFGEIRDYETGDVAMRASATGHLVLGTLHTGGAVDAVNRLRGIGLDDGEIASGLLGVLAQRLVRRICLRCSAPSEVTAAQARAFSPLLENIDVFAGRGCRECHETGYKGRLGLFELFVVDEALQHDIATGADLRELQRIALERGMVTMLDDGLAKVRAGLTTLDELQRVVPYRHIEAARRRADAESA